MTKKLSSLLLSVVFSLISVGLFAQGKTSSVTLAGKLVNFPGVVPIEDMSEYQYLRPTPSERTISADAAGNFKIKFSLGSPGYFRIGRNILYLTPGDNMEVVIDNDEFLESTFKGQGEVANLFLRNTPFPKGGSYLNAGRNIKPSILETMQSIQKMAEKRQHELDNLKNVSAVFVKLETARIKADMIKSYVGIKGYAGNANYRKSDEYKRAFADSLERIVNPEVEKLVKGFIDTSLLKLVVYRDLYQYLKTEETNHPTNNFQQIEDWRKAETLAFRLKTISDKNKLLEFKPMIDSIQTKKYREVMLVALNEKMKYGIGDAAIDFTAINTDGKPVKLSSLKGKVIYVDIWATWCGPCMAEMPSLEILKKKYENNPELAIVSLSFDDTDKIWLASLKERKVGGIQWRINRNTMPDYDIKSIPRFLLFDKDFVVADLNAPMPSSIEIGKKLDELLAKPAKSAALHSPEVKFVLKGQIGTFGSPAKIYLSYPSAIDNTIDSLLMQNGKFEFRGVVTEPVRATLVVNLEGNGIRQKGVQYIPVYLESGEISVNSADSLSHAKISGSALNKEFENLTEALAPVRKKMAALSVAFRARPKEQQMDSVIRAEHTMRFNQCYEELKQVYASFIKANPGTFVSLDALKSFRAQDPDYNKLAPLYEVLSPSVKNSDAGKKFAATLDVMKVTAIGVIAPDFVQNSPEGKPIKMSDFRGKYLLIDFWASWCGPCRAENPVVVKAYAKYHDKGFEILGVSLDNPTDKEKWVAAIQKDGLTWPQVSDLKGWKSEVTQMYGVQYVPHNLLLDPQGKILVKDLRGKALEAKLAEIFK